MRPFARLLRALLGARRGSILVEFAVSAPVLILLVAGGIDFGLLAQEMLRAGDAARAGAQYGMQNTEHAHDPIAIEQAARAGAGDGHPVTVTSTLFCRCPSGEPVDCSGICLIGERERYLEVGAEVAVPPLIPLPFLPDQWQISRSVTLRIGS